MLFWENSGAMAFHSMLVLVTWVGVMLTAIMAAAAIAYPLALPNCSDSCGDVKIPYPFGTTEGCYRKESKDFFINCSKSYGQPQPLMFGKANVTSISVEGEIDIMMYSSINCYNQSGTPREEINTSPGLTVVPSFTVSITKNKFVAVGCDTYAFLNGILKDAPFTTGCLSKCNDTRNIVNGNCSGIGCCQIDIPEGLKDIDFAAYSFNNHSGVWSFNPCSFAFIIQTDKFSFSSAYLTSLQNNRTFPMVLDWAIGNETCEVARNKGNYICGANSTCSDLKNGSGPGYRCKCKEGYDGNPYLKDGCQDIDECNEEKICRGNQICVNEVGSYRCSCIKGYRKVEEECFPNSTIAAVVDRRFVSPKLNLVNVLGLNHLLRSEVFAHSDGQLRAAHLILGFTPISDSFQDVGDSIRARDKRINRIDVSRPGFLANKDFPPVPWPLQQVAPQEVAQEESSASTLPSLEAEIDQFHFEGEEEVQTEPLGTQRSETSEDIEEMPLNLRRGLKALIAGRSEGASSKEASKEKETGKLPPPPPSTTTTSLLPIPDLKRKKKVVDLDAEEGEVSPRQQKGGKQQRKDDRRASPPRHRSDPHPREVHTPHVWAPRLDLDGAPITVNASIREFQNGHSGYIAEALERPLLLPRDMDTVKSWRQADLFMSMKRDLAMLTQQVYVAEDWVRDARNLARVETQSRKEVEKNLGELQHQKLELSNRLTKEERDRRSAEAGLKNAQDQAEDQRKKLHMTEIELATARQLALDLRTRSEKAEKAEKEAKSALKAAEAEKEAAYLRGIEETERRLAEEVTEVCRDYCQSTWEEALNMAGVPADSELRQPGKTYFHPDLALTPVGPSSSSPRGPEQVSLTVISPGAIQEAQKETDAPGEAPESADPGRTEDAAPSATLPGSDDNLHSQVEQA